MAEPRQFNFDSGQRSVATNPVRRRRTWMWVVVSLVLHGAIILFALSGAARGGKAELLGTLDVTVVGPVSAGRPDGDTADADAKPVEKSPPSPLARPPAPERAPPRPEELPEPAKPAEAPKTQPLPQEADAAPLRPSPPPPPPEKKPPAPPRPTAAPAPKAEPRVARPSRRGVKNAPLGQTASLGSPTGGERLGHTDTDDGSGLLDVNLNPRFRIPPSPPHYPRASIAREEEGVVLVRALVDPAGAPQRVMVFKSSGYPNLDDAALEAVRRWRFEPMIRGGRTVVSWVQVPVRFRLN